MVRDTIHVKGVFIELLHMYSFSYMVIC